MSGKSLVRIFRYSIKDGEIIMHKYRKRQPVLEIPATIDGIPVTRIDDDFLVSPMNHGEVRGRNSTEEIILPPTIVSIGDRAFYNCENLKRVNLPEGLTEVGKSAFYGCTSLENVVIPSSLTYLSDFIFENSGIKTITLPDGLTEIGAGAFQNCLNLTEIVIPHSVRWIRDRAFYGCKTLKTVTLPDSLEEVGEDAFSQCVAVHEVKFSERFLKISNVDDIFNKLLYKQLVRTRETLLKIPTLE